nr:hypothetical protein [Dysosmobacter welbionis]
MQDMLAGSELCEKHARTRSQDSCLLQAMPQVTPLSAAFSGRGPDGHCGEMHSISDNREIFGTEDGDRVGPDVRQLDGTFVGSPPGHHRHGLRHRRGRRRRRASPRMVDRNLNDGLPPFEWLAEA